MFRKKSRMILAVVFCIVAGAADTAFSGTTGKVAGRILDDQGNPLPGANVVIRGTLRGAAADGEGYYAILLVEPGVHELEASMVGYQKVRKTDVRVVVGYTTTVDFSLKETTLEAVELVVTAERPPVEPDKTASKHYVTAEDIELTPVVKDAQAFAGLQPGVQHDGLSIRQGSIEVNFMDEARNKGWNSTTPSPVSLSYTVDGVRMVNNDGRVPNLFVGVNRASIQEISIVTGVPEAEYGNMDAGIINIVTKEGGRQFHGFGEYRYTLSGKRHFGFYAYDPRAHINTATGESRLRLDDPAWLNETDPVTGRLVHEQLSDYTEVSGHRVEGSLSGPLVSRATFHVSYLTDVQPTQRPRPALRTPSNHQLTGKLTFDLTPSINLKVGGVFGRSREYTTAHGSALGDDQNIFLPAGYSGSGAEVLWNAMGYAVLTHALSPRTLYEVRLSRFDNERDTVDVPRETRPFVRDGDTWFVVDRQVNDYRLERATRHNLKFDFSSQVTKRNFLKAGFDATWYRTWMWENYPPWNPDEPQIWMLHDLAGAAADRFGNDGRMDMAPILNGSTWNLPDFGRAGNLDDPIWNGFRDYPARAAEFSVYVQDKIEFEGMVVNVGLRYDGLFHGGQYRAEPMWNGLPTFRYYSDIVMGRYRQAQNPYPGDPTSYPMWKGENFHQFSPRFGISHPITDRSAIRFSYGRFMVLPIFFSMYGENMWTQGGTKPHSDLNQDGQISSYEYYGNLQTWGNIGYAGMKAPTTVNYELGLDWNFVKDYTGSATVFYRRAERYAQAGGSGWMDPAERARYNVTWYMNGMAMETRGLEVAVSKRFSSYFSFRATYSWYWELNNNRMTGNGSTFYPDSRFLASGAYSFAHTIDPQTGQRLWQPLSAGDLQALGEYADAQIKQELEAGSRVEMVPSAQFQDLRPGSDVGTPLTGEKNIAVQGWYTSTGSIRGPNDQRDASGDGSFTLLFASPPDFGPAWNAFYPLGDLKANLILRVQPGTFFQYSSPVPSPLTDWKLVNNTLMVRNPTYFLTDLGVEKGVRVGKFRPVAFLEITNLFNSKQHVPVSRWGTFNPPVRYGLAQNQVDPETQRTGNTVWDLWQSFRNRTREFYFGIRMSM